MKRKKLKTWIFSGLIALSVFSYFYVNTVDIDNFNNDVVLDDIEVEEDKLFDTAKDVKLVLDKAVNFIVNRNVSNY